MSNHAYRFRITMMVKMASAVLLGVSLSCYFALGEVPLGMASVPKLKGGVTLDGKLDESIWSKSRILGPLVENDRGGRAVEITTVRLFFDDQNLYLGWEIFDRDIQATFVARDSHFWEEEVVEFFLSTASLDRYFELQWNPIGGVFDAIIDNKLNSEGKSKGIKGDWDFTAKKMRSMVKVSGTVSDSSNRDDKWTVEVVIPFADLGVEPPRSGVEWRANFYRFNRGQEVGVEKQSWSPTLDRMFHQPSRFGVLKFE
ncbi:MAG: carbohydrate-binding family 9-like protein [Verrucomicrobia bacterium]|nr:carbohydrate-binding family 9-like protein [Verrucomicrobiota bacterium]